MSTIRSNVVRMTGYVPGEQPTGDKFIKLNTNENPYPCSPRVKSAIGRVVQQGLQKYPDPLATAFRIRLGQLLHIDPDWVMCGNGSDDILTIVTRCFVEGGDCVRFPNPSYVLYRTLADIQDARCDVVNYQPDWSLSDRFWAPRERLKLVYLANPNSPSGTMISPDRVAQIADALPCPLLVDEAYVDFADAHCVSLVAENEQIMVSRTLSKSYALAGLRFGYLIAQPQVIHQLCKVKDSYNCDALSIAGATAAIDDQEWLTQNRTTLLATRARLTAELSNLGFDTVPSQANFVWNTHSELPVEPIFQSLRQKGVLIRYMSFPDWGDGLRVTVGTDEQIDAFLTMLRAAL